MNSTADFPVKIPTPKIKTRAYNEAIEAEGLSLGLHPVIARIIAGRPISTEFPLLQALSPRLSQLSNPFRLFDMEKAVERVAKAVMNAEVIGLETDHDCDGQTSHAVLYHNLVERFRHPKEKLRSYIGHRLTEGYGLSDAVANRILNDNPRVTLLITADNGSTDEPRIARLKETGIDVIVTDHHQIPVEGCPKSAYACLNPARSECEYGDPYIAGCMVAWLLMAGVRQKLIEMGYLDKTEPTLTDSLDFVAVGTVADCVSIARSANNRAVVSYGLKLIDVGSRPCWRALKNTLKGACRSEDVGFKIGPLLNSDGRLSSAFGSVSFLLAETDKEAEEWLKALEVQNQQRKTIQKDIVSQAILIAKQQMSKHEYVLSIFLKDGHSGVQGIAASRIKDLFGRPTVIFASKPGHPDIITGSMRGIENFHVREALQQVSEAAPGLLMAFGGHKGAAGLTIAGSNFERFCVLLEEACAKQLQTERPLEPIIWTDGVLPAKELQLDFLDELERLEPFGREFEPPIFELIGQLTELRAVGDGTHIRVSLEIEGLEGLEGRYHTGIWFSARNSADEALPVKVGEKVQVAFSLRENIYRGNRSLDIQIVSMRGAVA